jgi:hypothetical protein
MKILKSEERRIVVLAHQLMRMYRANKRKGGGYDEEGER